MAERFQFSGLKEILAKANEQKSGDELAGIAARSERERVAAKCALADLTLGEIVAQPLIEDNLVSNIHARGLGAEEAAARIGKLAAEFIRLGASGTAVKEPR